MKEIPDIAIFRVGSQFRVEICGKPIERLRSFEIKVSNERGRGGTLGIAEYPHYTVEQYMEPANPKTQTYAGRTAKRPAEGRAEKPEELDQTSS